ncbi:ABC transporter ATP-binding protein [Aquabacterium olei]|uniref:ABC transporter ATP-binding protein n=1 Tax=Aquabacterium olei TaxID=1296669 RepID=A0A2U8FVL9_9BURK|nr:ABC transporter ATP-binding protein [Aquabacterium olei]AWI55060.1 ABC transporter ATP-binding protein [Aquabacterium olei]
MPTAVFQSAPERAQVHVSATHDAAWLVVDRIALRYGTRTVVSDLSFALPRGTLACLLGPSGCGKTSALRAIAGFEPLFDGQIRLAGQVLSAPGRLTPPEKRRIGMVFQDYALFPHLTVAQNVGFGLRGQGDATDRVAAMLDTVGLAAAAARYPHELSGGQQQRVALARALAPQPSILLLDEPFSNLDVALREHLAGEVRDILKATQTTAILVTHDQHEAFAMADVIGVLADGRLQQWDTAYGLYHRPANRRVANFIGQGAFVPATVLDAHRLSLAFDAGQVHRDDTTFTADTALPFTPGSRVDVLLRPDDVVHDDASPLQARIVHKAFKGAEFLYTLALPSGNEVLSLVPSHHDHAIGEPIGIRLEMDHLVAFPQEGAGR